MRRIGRDEALSTLGVARLPDHGMSGKQTADGIRLFVMPVAIARSRKPGSTRPHRIHAVCPDCGRWVPTGRAAQHVCKRAQQA